MREAFFTILVLSSLLSYSQVDTTSIKAVLNYMHTNEFRIAFMDTLEKEIDERIHQFKLTGKKARAYRKREISNTVFWLDTTACFVPKSLSLILNGSNSSLDNNSGLIIIGEGPRSMVVYDSLPFILNYHT